MNMHETPKEFVGLENAKAKRQKPQVRFNRTCTNTLMQKEFPPIQWCVRDYLAEGFNVLAGRQKLGKTWMALDFAIAKAIGGFALGSIECDPGDVLYVDLENGPRRIQRRIETLFPDERKRPDLYRLEWATETPPLHKGFLDACDDWQRSVENPALIVIDVLQRIKPVGSATRNAYENDYAAYQDIQSWATENRVTVLGLHHTKKGGADDPLEALNGSNGLSAVADTTLVLDRNSNGMTLYVRGRDVEELETALNFNGGNWMLLGKASEVRRSDERNTILNVLLDADEPMSPTEIADDLGANSKNIKHLIAKMAKAGEVTKVKRGSYLHNDKAVTPGYNDYRGYQKEKNQ